VIEDAPSCAHYWKIESPTGPWSLGVCGKCGEYDAFKNSVDETIWSGPQRTGKKPKAEPLKNPYPSKEEFLSSIIPPRRASNGMYTEEFKLKMVTLALQGNRSRIRQKFNIPETTLRGWINQHQQGGPK